MTIHRSVPWAAGIIEGEGYIGVVRERDNRVSPPKIRLCPKLSVGMTDIDIIDNLQEVFGGRGNRHVSQPYKAHHKVAYVLTFRREEDVEFVLRKIHAYLGKRRKKQSNRTMRIIKAKKRLRANRGKNKKS